MFHTGLVSISFRKLSPERILERLQEAGLDAIEWGGDVHVPHGDLIKAKAIGQATRDSGIAVACYGSYYRAGSTDKNHPSWNAVLDTAVALEAPLIRIWAGPKGSADTTAAERKTITEDIHRVAESAGSTGVSVALEYHGGTLTDTDESTALLLDEVSHPALSSLWQPRNGVNVEKNLKGLKRFLPRISNVHVFHWLFGENGQDRRPLIEGELDWLQYLSLASSGTLDRYLLLEFLRNDSEEQFLEDARILQNWIRAVEANPS